MSQARYARKTPDARKTELLAAAVMVFAERGYRSADVQEVADRAGVGKGTVYRYFSGKEDLFCAALTQQVDALEARMCEGRDRHSDPLERLRSGIRAAFAFFDEHPETVDLFIQERAEFRDRGTPLYFARSMSRRHEWAPEFEALMVSGRMRKLPVEALMDGLGDLVYGAVMSSEASAGRPCLVDRFDQLFDIYLHGALEGS
ncbi:transcriptional regulator, TetR family [Thioalkalivibrio sp. K90mix]|uniref:TetR/AcrR family transcriptional regulator n=1 Tax=Thioalkalivibrio sp. (strain K90mix) TaxID=396595 RepID=UPI0001C4E202|nr:TetR/AcrR family transcriptional regulator [Thioalkalivibrio sp. K90mix]ADC72413.1 transcriptional regulator, TetR family [Thioalkalivibrio sp. K90mix]